MWFKGLGMFRASGIGMVNSGLRCWVKRFGDVKGLWYGVSWIRDVQLRMTGFGV